MPSSLEFAGALSLDQRRTLISLRRRLADFREGRRRWADVPAELQREAAAAIDGGIAATCLREVCGIPSNRLGRWVSAGGDGGPGMESTSLPPEGSRGVAAPRVLRVVQDAGAVADGDDVALTIRMGSWRLSLQLTAVGEEAACCR